MLTIFDSNKEFITAIVAVGGGSFALWRWVVDQKWRRIQYAQQLIKEFFASPNTKLSLRMLDVMGTTELPPAIGETAPQIIELDEAMLIESLQTIEQQPSFGEPHFTIRMTFDQFFTDLSMFQHHIDAQLIKLQDVSPYLEYWIKSINGNGKILGPSLAEQINRFLISFDYVAVLKLSQSITSSGKKTTN